MSYTLIFVYNANGDLFSKMSDFAHKILSPSTYACSLCALTYDNFGIKNEWANFLQQLNLEQGFYHKDEFIKKYNLPDTAFPAIYIKQLFEIKIFIPPEEINACKSYKELEYLITQKIKEPNH